jgi:hypothetical protein
MQNSQWWTNWNLEQLDDPVFGPIYGGQSVQEAIYQTLNQWLPTYLAAFNRKIGVDALTNAVTYRKRPEDSNLPAGVSAQILVEVPATAGAPQVYKDATRVDWRVSVVVFVNGTKDWQETQALTHAYVACVRTCLLQQRGLGGFAETTSWMGEEYAEGDHVGTRTIGVGHIAMIVTVGNAVNVFNSPPAPSISAPSNWPEVQTTNINVT